jgi:solute carrier family 25 phosphate transporter 3
MVDGLRKIAQREGVAALTLGLAPTTLGYILQGACKFGFFEFFKSAAVARLGTEFAQKNSFAVYVTSSTLAETIASVVLCPFEALRIRSVARPDYAKNMIDGFKRMHAEEGFNGFYKGLGMLLAKQLPYTVTQLTVFSKLNDVFYDQLYKYTSKSKIDLSTSQQLSVSVACGIVAGVASAIASHPPDTILSRLNMEAKKQIYAGTVAKKTSNWEATKQIVNELGFKGLWKGLGTRCFMVGTLSAGMFLIYDSVKVACGLPTSSGVGKKQ